MRIGVSRLGTYGGLHLEGGPKPPKRIRNFTRTVELGGGAQYWYQRDTRRRGDKQHIQGACVQAARLFVGRALKAANVQSDI